MSSARTIQKSVHSFTLGQACPGEALATHFFEMSLLNRTEGKCWQLYSERKNDD